MPGPARREPPSGSARESMISSEIRCWARLVATRIAPSVAGRGETWQMMETACQFDILHVNFAIQEDHRVFSRACPPHACAALCWAIPPAPPAWFRRSRHRHQPFYGPSAATQFELGRQFRRPGGFHRLAQMSRVIVPLSYAERSILPSCPCSLPSLSDGASPLGVLAECSTLPACGAPVADCGSWCSPPVTGGAGIHLGRAT